MGYIACLSHSRISKEGRESVEQRGSEQEKSGRGRRWRERDGEARRRPEEVEVEGGALIEQEDDWEEAGERALPPSVWTATWFLCLSVIFKPKCWDTPDRNEETFMS